MNPTDEFQFIQLPNVVPIEALMQGHVKEHHEKG